MEIPDVFFGKYQDVQKRCRKLAKQVIQGKHWEEVFHSIPMVDTANVPGLITLERGAASLLGDRHFHCYFLLQEIDALRYKYEIQEAIHNSIFEESLKTPWGTLGLFGDGNLSWFSSPKTFVERNGQQVALRDVSRWNDWIANRCQPMVEACLEFWDIFNAEGKRYTEGLPYPPRSIWYYARNLRYVLSNMGVPSEFLVYPKGEISFPDKICRDLPDGGLPALVALAKSRTPTN
jgi:hypothetical protein